MGAPAWDLDFNKYKSNDPSQLPTSAYLHIIIEFNMKLHIQMLIFVLLYAVVQIFSERKVIQIIICIMYRQIFAGKFEMIENAYRKTICLLTNARQSWLAP